jgi:hypothetical protein
VSDSRVISTKQEVFVPILQRLLERANHRFSSDQIGGLDPDTFNISSFADRDLLVNCADALGIATNADEREVLRSCPLSIQIAILGIAHSAVQRSRTAPVPIAFVWMSGYDFELSVFEARTGANSWGGITLILRTPYPA